MLEAIGATPGSVSEADWHSIWRTSPEHQNVQAELARLRTMGMQRLSTNDPPNSATHMSLRLLSGINS
jgi:ATP-binding cassette subfamily G (WHITE) protein 2 (PDR)